MDRELARDEAATLPSEFRSVTVGAVGVAVADAPACAGSNANRLLAEIVPFRPIYDGHEPGGRTVRGPLTGG